jgi:hypothetical protein
MVGSGRALSPHLSIVRRRGGGLSCVMLRKPGWRLFLAVILAFAVLGATARAADAAPPAKPTLAQIVAGIQAHNQLQNQGLREYHALRTYSVVYHGLGTLTAKMQVEVSYDAGQGKSFRIVSQHGPVLLRDAVLKRALESERDASREREATALSPANYSFRLLGSGTVNGRPVYILAVAPLKPEKFLYRGTVWLDARTYGVVKIEAAPAKNPSFWISHTTIWVTDVLTDGFWLPEQTRSQTAVRLGGTATMTIDYGQYQINQESRRSAELLQPRESTGAKPR